MRNRSIKLQDYQPIVGKNTIDELGMLAEKLKGKTITNINSTFSGGGVAEIFFYKAHGRNT